MKSNLFFAAAAAIGTLGITGCTTIRELPAEQVAREVKNPEHELCRELLMAVLKNDAKGFVSRLPEDYQKKFNVAEFTRNRDAIAKTLGQPVSFRYLTTLEFVTFKPHVWSVRFEREDSAGKKIRSEALFRITTGRDTKGQILVIGFNFL